jgi:excisionase family DNA binding protein
VSPEERDRARQALGLVSGRPWMIGGDGKPIELPGSVADALVEVLEAFAEGDRPLVVRASGDLTTEQAAVLLGVSRPTVVRMIDRNKLPAHKVGTHRRLALRDVLAYQALSSSRRRGALDEMTRQAEELGLYG